MSYYTIKNPPAAHAAERIIRNERSADPRGPMRKIVSVDWTKDGNVLQFECGCVGNYAAHFSVKPGQHGRAFGCKH